MALTQPKCPSISFLKRLVQPASLRLWNSSFRSGCPVSSLRDRKPTVERIPQPFSSFILSPFVFTNTPSSSVPRLEVHSGQCGTAAAMFGYMMVETPLLADVDVVLYLLRPLSVPAAASCSGGGSLSLSPCPSPSITRHTLKVYDILRILLILTNE